MRLTQAKPILLGLAFAATGMRKVEFGGWVVGSVSRLGYFAVEGLFIDAVDVAALKPDSR